MISFAGFSNIVCCLHKGLCKIQFFYITVLYLPECAVFAQFST